MKNLCLLLCLCAGVSFAQVGIGTVTPNASLDIKSSDELLPSNTDGLLIPKIEEFPLTIPTINQDGMLVYVTGNGTVSKGFYYWDDTSSDWVPVVNAASSVTKIDDLSDGKSDSDGTNDGSSIFLGLDSGGFDDGTDNQNVGVGFHALFSNTSGLENVGVGFRAINSNTTGWANVATGSASLLQNTTGTFNTASGASSLFYNSTGFNNTAHGRNSLFNIITGNNNTALGASSGSSVQGENNLFLGYRAGDAGLTRTLNGSIMIGHLAGYGESNSNRLYIENSNADADNALIYGEFDNDILRTNGTFQIGNPAGTGYAFPAVDGTVNQVMQTNGAGAMTWVDPSATVIHDINDLVDGRSDNDGTEDGSSIFLGIDAGIVDDGTNNRNVGIGFESLLNSVNGINNVAVGYRSLQNLSTGVANTAIGLHSMMNASGGIQNVALGSSTLENNTTGIVNVATGSNALNNNTTGELNVAVGGNSLFANTAGSGNVAVGTGSMALNDLGSNNIAIGRYAGYFVQGNENVFIGAESGSNNSSSGIHAKSGSVFIGHHSGLSELNSDRLYIENSNSTTPLIYGEFDNDILNFNGDVGINTTSPSASLHVNHQSGASTEGFVLSNQVDADAWRFYVQWSSNTLALMYNNVNVGNFDDVSGVYTAVSDRNLKRNISQIPSVLEKVQQLEVVNYNFQFQKDSKKYIGLIAQDVEAVFPHLVIPPNEESENYTMDYSGFGVLAIKSVQEQQEEIDQLRQELSEIKALLRNLND